jgi:hypothetical protein
MVEERIPGVPVITGQLGGLGGQFLADLVDALARAPLPFLRIGRLMVSLAPPRQDIGQVPRPRAVVDLDQSAPEGRLGQQAEDRAPVIKLVAAVGVVVERVPRRGVRRPFLRFEEMTVGRLPEMGQVESAEDAVPIGVVALGLIEVPERRPSFRSGPDLPRDHDHALLEVVGLGVLAEEVAKETAPEKAAVLGSGPGLERLEGRLVVRFEDPLHHLFIGRRRKVDPAGGGMAVEIVREGHRSDPSFLDEGEEAPEPTLLVNPFLGSRPDPELLAVVAEDGRPAGVADRSEVGVDLVERTKRDEVAELLVDGKDAQAAPLILRDVGRGQVPDPRVMEMFLVEERVFDARGRQGLRQMRFPDPLGQPQPARPLAEILEEEVVHHPDLADPVLLGDDRQDGLVEPAAQELDLASAGELLDEFPAGPFVLLHIFPERPGKVEGEAEAGTFRQRLEQRPVAVVERRPEDVVEVPHRLVVVDREEKNEFVHSGSSTPASRQALRT